MKQILVTTLSKPSFITPTLEVLWIRNIDLISTRQRRLKKNTIDVDDTRSESINISRWCDPPCLVYSAACAGGGPGLGDSSGGGGTGADPGVISPRQR